MTRPVSLLILLFPLAALASTPPSTPTPRPTRPVPIFGKSDKAVAGPRSLADAAKERPKKGGTVSQMDSSVDQYEYVPAAPERGPAPKQRSFTFTIPTPAPNGPTHGVPQVGMSIEDHRAAQAAAAATPAPPPSTKKKK